MEETKEHLQVRLKMHAIEEQYLRKYILIEFFIMRRNQLYAISKIDSHEGITNAKILRKQNKKSIVAEIGR